MVEELFSKVLSNPLLVFLFVVVAVVFVAKEISGGGKKRYYRKRRGGYRPEQKVMPQAGEDPALASAADQLRTVMGADFKSRALLNRPEAAVFKALDEAVIARNPKWQVMAQVSLGEFLSSPNRSAYFAVNSKRVDFALMDEKCCVRHALEYQGNGHHQGNAAARDAVKKEALRKAGIGYHEVVAGHTTPSELRALVEKLVPGE
ncbi:DUF2726 domain-containing protein [Qipengyuania soli]|uniref:DUF2726 domain-containing protein n=1 Tax=Qipengyuania soli TaxID=2782568 RepID=A0A7S8F4Q3_9SPHN|nr:DUF2726 domain-containing protein [Qipengyuania soli]QPC99053.1 DUF2726 domain-containing protein [Qipengyuania soli]